MNIFGLRIKKSTWAFEVQHLYQDDPFYNPDLQRTLFRFRF
jgi:hypothetical protein